MPAPSVSYYERHVFFCCNQRKEGEACCNNHGAQEIRDYAKDKIKSLRLAGRGKVRINMAGCLDRCDEGPVMVVYPEAVWYTYVDREDIDEIVQRASAGRPHRRAPENLRPAATETVLVDGPAGKIEVDISDPGAGANGQRRGIALIAHPHPLMGGTKDNKVVTTLARTLVCAGHTSRCARISAASAPPKARTTKAAAKPTISSRVAHYARARYGDLPLTCAGFSFGSFVQTRVAQRARRRIN